MTNPSYDGNADVNFVRKQLRKRSNVLAEPAMVLQDLINNGWQAVRTYYPCENASRAFDASAVWTAAFGKLDVDPMQDIHKRMNILRLTSESLLGDFGLRRYNGDSYLSTNYWHKSLFDNRGQLHPPGTPKQGFASEDVSDPAQFAARGALVVKGYEAQWVLPVPVMAIAYSRLLNQALNKVEEANPEREALIADLWKEENFFIARTLAALTPEGAKTSNGSPAKAYAFPEAYESITLLQESRFADRYGFIVGAHTPLTWTVANAFGAFERFAKDQVTMEKLM